MKTYYVIMQVTPPSGPWEVGFEMEAQDISGVFRQCQLLNHLQSVLLGIEIEVREVALKKRRGLEYLK